MEVNLPKPGTYVIAVSGGIDSVCLLHLLADNPAYSLIVAHYDHGIRTDSSADRYFVQELAKANNLQFVYEEGRLGKTVSEADARRARYAFLRRVVRDFNSDGIITAHHQDDRLETLLINLIRGTGRKGLSSLQQTATLKRPLLNISKAELRDYAAANNLTWREDSTNQNPRYLRNYIRLQLLPKLSASDRQKLLEIIDRQGKINSELDRLIVQLISDDEVNKLSRRTVNLLPYAETKELIASWLRANNLVNFDHKTIERLTLAAKTKRPGTKLDVYNKVQVKIDKEFLALDTVER